MITDAEMRDKLEEIRIVKRVTLKLGRRKRTQVLVAPPYPRVGDELTYPNGETWMVSRIKDEQCFAEFDTEGGKLRQVFP